MRVRAQQLVGVHVCVLLQVEAHRAFCVHSSDLLKHNHTLVLLGHVPHMDFRIIKEDTQLRLICDPCKRDPCVVVNVLFHDTPAF